MKKRMNILYLAAVLTTIFAALGSISVGAVGGGAAANGQGFFTDAGGGLRTFSFSAVTKKDGTVTGQANLHNRDSGDIYKVEVNCLQLYGNIAVVSGIVRNSTVPVEGQNAVFVAIDNGEGNADSPDRISRMLITPEQVDCRSDELAFRFYDIEGGNIQVKP